MTVLEKRMVLHRFMCSQFGYKNLREMSEKLVGALNQLDGNESSPFAQAILSRFGPYSPPVTREYIARYDANIAVHSQKLGMTEDKGKSWKPFQYLALLFTERYLDLYFEDPELLAETVNKWKQGTWTRAEIKGPRDIPDYTTNDLRTLAFQSATGSGKTLLLHANILQYQHYLKAHNRLHKLNKIILVTPDEGLSRQHLAELQASNIPAQLFSDRQGSALFAHQGAMVDIIDLHKLDEKKGIKRVALEAFEDNNLVLVDEGHLGTGGKVWRKRRKQLARNGFTFEYSATFNQAVAGSGDEIKELRNEYGKSILFDYSYKFFYDDGYGKDYQISNLHTTDDGEANNFYLLACLLVFYQQCRIYEDKSGQWREFNIAPPLWVFLGRTVTGGKSKPEQATETDVIRIINFLAWVLSNQQQIIDLIGRLTSGNTGLIDEHGTDIFSHSFDYIKGTSAQGIYDALCLAVFHGKGQLHISHLTGTDELQFSAGDANSSGVINVGDASGLYTKLEAVDEPLFVLSKNAFAKPLFAQVDHYHSPINIVIGARKFVAGWNSWRVSTMGLMHVGTGEGPQIIQMFGRGVRLKGYGMSLKRHTALEGARPTDSDQLKLLETLNIFGLKANYMDKFKDYLQKEGVPVDRVTFTLPTKKQFSEVKDLKILKKRDTAGEFQYSDKRLDLPGKPGPKDTITLDRYRHLEVLGSEQQKPGQQPVREEARFEKKHLDLINTRSVYHKLLDRKRLFSWHNMTIAQATVDELLTTDDWYHLYIPPEKLELSQYSRVKEWENLAVDLISEYANQYWRKERSKWEAEHIEVVPLDDNNSNYFDEYELSIDAKEKDLIKDIEALAENIKNDNYSGAFIESIKSGSVQLSLLAPNFHAYIPLLQASVGKEESIKIFPISLTAGEAGFVIWLESIVEDKNADFLQNKKIYLMRNLSRGKGVSFFDDYSFYPDFILWVTDSKRQDILFIDPKGLVRFDSKTKSKVDLHTRIKDTEKKIQEKHPDIFLHSYIWSSTSPEDIGTDEAMTRESCRERGIFLARGGDTEIRALLKQALG